MYNRKDHYFRKAKEEGYRARSAFKLSSLYKRYSIIKKNDGTYQYVYTALPLYYYVGDKNPGDVSGNGLNDGKWSIVSVTK